MSPPQRTSAAVQSKRSELVLFIHPDVSTHDVEAVIITETSADDHHRFTTAARLFSYSRGSGMQQVRLSASDRVMASTPGWVIWACLRAIFAAALASLIATGAACGRTLPT